MSLNSFNNPFNIPISTPPTIPGDTEFRTTRIWNLAPLQTTGPYTTWKVDVRVATTANITLQGIQTIDGVVLTEGDRVLVKNQTSGVNNGIYVVGSQNWYRDQDLPLGSQAASVAVFINEGTTNKDNLYLCTNTTGSDTVGTNALVFVPIAGPSALTTLTNTHIFVGNSSNIATDVAMSGDATISNTGVLTLTNTSVTPGSYTSTNLTVDAAGRITFAESSPAGVYDIVTSAGTLDPANTSIISLTPTTYTFGNATTSIGTPIIRGQVTDSVGNVYVVGSYGGATGAITNRDGSQSSLVLPLPSATSMYVIKYGPNGIALGYTTITTTLGSSATAIAVDSDDNIFVGGNYRSAAICPVYNFTTDNNLEVINFSLPTAAVSIPYIVKFSPSGAALSWTTLGADTSSGISSIIVDSSKNLYVAGIYNSGIAVPVYNFSSNNTLGPGTTFSLQISTGVNQFLVKWSSTGTATSWTAIVPSGTNSVNSIKVDSGGNVFYCGFYLSAGTVAVYDLSTNNTIGPGTTFSLTGGGGTLRSYLIKWLAAGTASLWTTLTGDASVTMRTLKIDSDSNIFVAGNYSTGIVIPVYNLSSNGTLGPGTIFSLSAGGTNAIMKWNSSGTSESWTQLNGGTSDIRSMTIDASDCVNVIFDVTVGNACNFSITSSLTTRISVNANNLIFLKWLPSGILDLGTLTTPVEFTIPAGDTGVISEKKVILLTTNFQYLFFLDGTEPYSVSVPGTFGPEGLTLVFLFNGDNWLLVS